MGFMVLGFGEYRVNKHANCMYFDIKGFFEVSLEAKYICYMRA